MLRVSRATPLHRVARLILDRGRAETLSQVPDNIMLHDLRRGIPFEDDSVDVVYHSHLLEHLDKDVGEEFLTEARRVLKPGGVHRIVVPDLEVRVRRYLKHLDEVNSDQADPATHDDYIEEILEQSVRREAVGTSRQNRVRRRIENLILGDARSRGETHQWMYDSVSLPAKVRAVGFREVVLHAYDTSSIPDWNEIGLDLDGRGHQYRPGSLYVECLA